MKYIIEEEELKDLVSGYYTFSGQPVYKWVNDFLKSKTPVEEIAEGEITLIKWISKEPIGDAEWWKPIYNKKSKIYRGD